MRSEYRNTAFGVMGATPANDLQSRDRYGVASSPVPTRFSSLMLIDITDAGSTGSVVGVALTVPPGTNSQRAGFVLVVIIRRALTASVGQCAATGSMVMVAWRLAVVASKNEGVRVMAASFDTGPGRPIYPLRR